jgi:hypothetical protein
MTVKKVTVMRNDHCEETEKTMIQESTISCPGQKVRRGEHR